jgi:hypothetical protein
VGGDFSVSRSAGTRLKLGPWSWPANAAEWPERAQFLEISLPTTWGVLLPTVVEGESGAGALLVAETGRAAAPLSPGTPLAWSEGARGAWRAATQAAPGALPLLWARLEAVAQPEIRVLTGADSVARVDGASLGLPFALLLVAAVSGLQVPADLAATGEILADGQVGPVQGFTGKIEKIQRDAPHVRRVLVPAADADLARARVSPSLGDLRVVGVATVREAVTEAFGGALAAAFDALGAAPAGRARTVEALLGLALDHHVDRACWPPIAAAARRARLDWANLDAAEARTLAFAESVALRHAPDGAFRPPLAVPDEADLRRLPVDRRTKMRADLVQQSADLGVPTPAEALALAEGHWASGGEAWPQQVQLTGAVGRLRAAQGQSEAGLALSLAAAQTWAERREPKELSYPLCEVYRLAAALDDEAAFARAEAWRAEFLGADPASAQPFLALARGMAAVLRLEFGHAPEAGALADLASVQTHPFFDGGTRAQVARWCLRRALHAGGPLDASMVDRLTSEPEQAALHALDRALFAEDAEAIAAAMVALAGLRDRVQALGGLLDAGLSPEAIARLYPY